MWSVSLARCFVMSISKFCAAVRGYRLLIVTVLPTPKITPRTASSSTFDSLLDYVGAQNVAADAGLTGAHPLSVERLLLLDPDALVVGVPPGEEAAVREQLAQMPGLGALRALQQDRLVCVPSALLLSTSHHIAGAAEHIAATLDRWERP